MIARFLVQGSKALAELLSDTQKWKELVIGGPDETHSSHFDPQSDNVHMGRLLFGQPLHDASVSSSVAQKQKGSSSVETGCMNGYKVLSSEW